MDYKKIYTEIMSNIETIRKEKTTPEFFAYAKDVQTYLAKMKPKESFDIEKNVKVETTHDFLKAVALYIYSFGEIDFSLNYKRIVKYERL